MKTKADEKRFSSVLLHRARYQRVRSELHYRIHRVNTHVPKALHTIPRNIMHTLIQQYVNVRTFMCGTQQKALTQYSTRAHSM